MPLYLNGALIPENVAGNFKFNGIDITKVFMNGLQVWAQSLFNGIWSGDSTYSVNGFLNGIDTSGSSYRFCGGTGSAQAYGVWGVADSNGLVNVTSTITVPSTVSITAGFQTIAPSTFKMVHSLYAVLGLITFSKTSGFTGSSTLEGDSVIYETSSGLIRYRSPVYGAGSWISLT